MGRQQCRWTSNHIQRDRQLDVRIHQYSSIIEAIIISNYSQDMPLAIRTWGLDEKGIVEHCICSHKCKHNGVLIKPELPKYIDRQLYQKIDQLRERMGIHPEKVEILTINDTGQLSFCKSLQLTGIWKNKSFIQQVRKRFEEVPDDKNKEIILFIEEYHRQLSKATSLIAKEEFTKAEEVLKKAISFFPDDPKGYYVLGNLYKDQGRLREAEKNLSIALSNWGKMCRDMMQPLENTLSKQIEEELIAVKTMRTARKLKKDEIDRQIEKKDIEPKSHYQPQVKVSIQFDDFNPQILTKLNNEEFDRPDFFNLLLQAQKISSFQGFEQLLCLKAVNIEHYQYQIETARKVLRRFGGRAILADEVGLGKTIEAGLILKEYFLRGLVSKVLILTVPSLVSQWQEEMETKFNLKFITTDDVEFDRKETNFWHKHDLIIASLHTAKRENHRQAIHQIDYDLLIIDEAHHLKSKATLSWQFVNEIKKKFVLLLTATPIQNNLEELYNMITILKPGQLKTLTTFKRNFITRGNPKKPKNKEELRELLAEVMIRNTRAQIDIKLPKREANTIKIHLLPHELSIYHHISNFIKEEYALNTPLNKFLLMMLQREIGSSVSAVIPTLKKMSENTNITEVKRKRLIELYEEADKVNEETKIKVLSKIINSLHGEKCLIFTQFLETQKVIQQALHQGGISTSIFNGQMSSADKNLNIKNFQDQTQILISTEAGGEGRNLQFCHIMLNYDLPWNPMRIEQRVGRICRIGQKKEVYIFNLSSQETIESYILTLLDEKINMFELVIGEMDMILGNLNEDKEFEDMIMEIWTSATTKDELEEKIQLFGNQLESAKRSYLSTKELEEALFGEDYEVE